MEKVKVISPTGDEELHLHANARDLVANAGWTYADKAKKARPAVNAKNGAKAAKIEAQSVIDSAGTGTVARDGSFGTDDESDDE